MMVIWHMHHPKVPAYVHSCYGCRKEILTGHRHECPTCTDFNLCGECYRKPIGQAHPHKLKKLSVTAAGESELQASRNRERAIRLHMQLLVHASACRNPRCPSVNCSKMKHLLKHGATCVTRATGGCHICRRIWALLQIHAGQCRERQCTVPRCRDLKEHLRRMQNQMDSRRRSAYRQGVDNDQTEAQRRRTIQNMGGARRGGKSSNGQTTAIAKPSGGSRRRKAKAKPKGKAKAKPKAKAKARAKADVARARAARAPKRSRSSSAMPKPGRGRAPKRARASVPGEGTTPPPKQKRSSSAD